MIEHANVFHSLSRFDHHIYIYIYSLQQAPETIKRRQTNTVKKLLAYNMFRKIVIIYTVHFIFSM